MGAKTPFGTPITEGGFWTGFQDAQDGLGTRGMLSSLRHLEIVVVRDVWNTHNQDAHAAASAMNDSGWDMS